MTYIWLLSTSDAASPDEVQQHLSNYLQDKHVLQVPEWLRAIVVWVLSRWHARRLVPAYRQLSGQTPLLDEMEQQARVLSRVLGARYQCRPVLYGGQPNAHKAAMEIGRGDRVILLPLEPQRGTDLYASIAAAQRELEPRTDKIAVIPSYPTHSGYIDVLSETLRSGILDLPQKTPYEVVFISIDPLTKMRAEQVGELHGTVQAVVDRVGLIMPHHLETLSADGQRGSAIQKIQQMGQRGQAVVVVPVSVPFSRMALTVGIKSVLNQIAMSSGVTHFICGPQYGNRPTFTRTLWHLIQDAEMDAGWKEGTN